MEGLKPSTTPRIPKVGALIVVWVNYTITIIRNLLSSIGPTPAQPSLCLGYASGTQAKAHVGADAREAPEWFRVEGPWVLQESPGYTAAMQCDGTALAQHGAGTRYDIQTTSET